MPFSLCQHMEQLLDVLSCRKSARFKRKNHNTVSSRNENRLGLVRFSHSSLPSASLLYREDSYSPMSYLIALKELTPNQRNAVLASFLGWTLDSFDFFIIVFVLRVIAKSSKQISRLLQPHSSLHWRCGR